MSMSSNIIIAVTSECLPLGLLLVYVHPAVEPPASQRPVGSFSLHLFPQPAAATVCWTPAASEQH